jgi:hypothetical protein
MIQAEEVIWRRIGDEIVVIKDDGLGLHILNPTAAIIWEMCSVENTVEQIVASLCKRFDVDPDEANTDVSEMLHKLADLGLLKPVEGANGL